MTPRRPVRPALLASLAALLLGVTPARADDRIEALTAPVLHRLAEEGYDVSRTRVTLLGRIQILAENDRYEREVVINRADGTILRDRRYAQDGDAPAGASQGQRAQSPDNSNTNRSRGDTEAGGSQR